jgi:hypothetical protein
MTDDTQPYPLLSWPPDPAAADDQGSGVRRRGLLDDIASYLHADAIVIAVVVGMVLTVLCLAGGSYLLDHADPSWIAQHPVIGGSR